MYLNDLVQPFKSGGGDIGMQAVVEARRTRPEWIAYLVAMAIKYRYRQAIDPIQETRTRLNSRRMLSAPHASSSGCESRAKILRMLNLIIL